MVLSSETLVDTTPDPGDMPEDRNFVDPIDDSDLRRTNPKRYDARQDWYNSTNEHGHDSPYENRYESTELFSSNNSRNIMKKWRQTLASTEDGFKPYKTDAGNELPNRATFTGDKEPSTGNSSDTELKAWKSDDKEGAADRKRERATEFGSSMMDPKIKQENVENHMKATAGWRGVFADFSLKKKNDGTLEVNITDTDSKVEEAPVEMPTANVPRQNTEPTPPTLNSMGSSSKVWTIAKKGSLILKGIDSPKFAAVTITDGADILLNHTVAKKGNPWREVIAQGIWETELAGM